MVSIKRIDFDSKGKPKKLVLSNDAEVASKEAAICELATAEGSPVELNSNKKWYRTDYSSDKLDCCPYNFVPAPKAPGPITDSFGGAELKTRRQNLIASHPELSHALFDPNLHTGVLDLELTVLSPTIVSHPPGADSVLGKEDQDMISVVHKEALDGQFGATKIEGQADNQWKQRIRPSTQIAPGRFIIPATSLKGMIRSVVECLSHSFMPFVSTDLEGISDVGAAKIGSRKNWRAAGHPLDKITVYTYDWSPGRDNWGRWVYRPSTPFHKLDHVNASQHPAQSTLACRIFGRVAADGTYPSWSGRLRFSSAIGWNQGEPTARAADAYWFLKSLTRPSGAKAKCEALYLLPDSGGVAKYGTPKSEARGFKFYWPQSLGGPAEGSSMSLLRARDVIWKTPVDRIWVEPNLVTAVDAFREKVRGHNKSQPDTKSWLRPLLPGSRFRFKVYFENLTKIELGALLRAVLLDNQGNGEIATALHCHRIGRAKPLGFGSITLTIRSMALLDIKNSYFTISARPAWKGDQQVSEIRDDSLIAFSDYSAGWRTPVWDALWKVTRIPDVITDRDYWKNWTDYNPTTAKPLPVL